MGAIERDPFAEEEVSPTTTIRTVLDALRWGDEWVAAHEALLKDFRRLEVKSGQQEWEIDYLRTLLRHLDPFLPVDMQSPELKAAAPQVYEAIARR